MVNVKSYVQLVHLIKMMSVSLVVVTVKDVPINRLAQNAMQDSHSRVLYVSKNALLDLILLMVIASLVKLIALDVFKVILAKPVLKASSSIQDHASIIVQKASSLKIRLAINVKTIAMSAQAIKNVPHVNLDSI